MGRRAHGLEFLAFNGKEGICLKLWILIFVCFLLCLTCFLIEHRRSNLSSKQSRNSKNDAEKLIQIRTRSQNVEIENNHLEEGSGFYMENINLTPNIQSQEIFNVNLATDDSDQDETHVMPAASNCISKKDGSFNLKHNLDVSVVKDYEYKDFIEDMEKLLEFPVFSETNVQDTLMDCNHIERIEIPLDNEQQKQQQWDSDSNEEEIILPILKQNNEDIFQLTSSIKEIPIIDLDLEDRFFPDEYAFRMDPSLEVASDELIATNHNDQVPDEQIFHNELLKEVPQVPEVQALPINNVHIPSIIDTFLGRISTLFVPPVRTIPKYPDLHYLGNFQEKQFSEERMKLASSNISPVWRTKPTPSRNIHRKIFRPTISTYKYPYAYSRKNSYVYNNNNNFLHQLLGLKANY